MTQGINPIEKGPTSSVKTLFKPDTWFAKIDFINHLILFNNVIISVLSDKEGGKTSFCSLLQNNLDSQIKYYAITAEPSCSKSDILQDIAKQLNLNYDPDIDVRLIESHINESKAHTLLIIDDAHFLPNDFLCETVEAIKNQSEFGFFHVCFVSLHSIIERLNALSDKPFNDLIHIIELSSLNESETRTYVLQRLMEKNIIKNSPTEQQIRQFYQLTKGNVSRINTKWDAFVSSCSKTNVKKMHFLPFAAILTLTAVILVFVWHRGPVSNVRLGMKSKPTVISYIPNIPILFQETKLAPIPEEATS